MQSNGRERRSYFSFVSFRVKISTDFYGEFHTINEFHWTICRARVIWSILICRSNAGLNKDDL